jgi:IS30 family transposase
MVQADYEELEAALEHAYLLRTPLCHSWERGSNENFNGLLRQFFPKGSDFSGIRSQQVDLAVNLLNTRPRKRQATEALPSYSSPIWMLRFE